MTRFNGRAARQARNQAMSDAERAANEAWKREYEQAIVRTAIALEYFNTDDVIARASPLVKTHEWRALGPLMLAAMRDGIIEKAPILPLLCNRPSRHAAPLTMWKSLIYGRRIPVAIPAPSPTPSPRVA